MSDDSNKHRDSASAPQGRPKSRREDEGPVIGDLIAHGREHFMGQKDQGLSYYVKIRTLNGKVRTFWGKDLDRAVHAGETRPKVGDRVGVRRIGHEPVTFREKVLDAQGRVIGETPRTAYRGRWQVESPQFFADRSLQARRARETQLEIREAIQKRPELKSMFLSRRAAELLAEQRISDPAERQRFLQLVDEAMAASIRRGEPLPEIRLRERMGPERRPAPEKRPQQDKQTAPSRTRDRDEPTR